MKFGKKLGVMYIELNRLGLLDDGTSKGFDYVTDIDEHKLFKKRK